MFDYIYENYENFGKCLKMSKDGIVVKITVDIGPRIIYFGNENKNFMWLDINRKVVSEGEFFDTNFKKGEKWYVYGGHRLWKSPEDMASYVPDNYPVDVEILENGARFTTPTQKLTGIKAGFDVIFNGKGIDIVHFFTNNGDKPITCSLWGITALKAGGVEIVPVNDDKTGLLPNRNFVFWEYADIKDKRLDIDNEFFTLTHDTNNYNTFKAGMFAKKGIATYLVDNDLFVNRFPSVDGRYGDFNSNFETYTMQDYVEMETIGSLHDIAPSETVTHKISWEAYFGVGEGKTLSEVKALVKTL